MKNKISFKKTSLDALAIIAIIASYFFISVYVIPEYVKPELYSLVDSFNSSKFDYYQSRFDNSSIK